MNLLNEARALLESINTARARLTDITPALFAEVRQAQGWTQQEMGDRLGVGRVYISQIEAGEKYGKQPSDDLYYKLLMAVSERECPNCGQTMFDVCAHCGYEQETKMDLKVILNYVQENARDVADLAALDTIKKAKPGDPYRKVLVRELRTKYEDAAWEADRAEAFD